MRVIGRILDKTCTGHAFDYEAINVHVAKRRKPCGLPT